MNGLLVDIGFRGHRTVLDGLFHQPQRIELWEYLACTMPTFEEVGLAPETSDLLVWQLCQNHEFVLLTGNRNGRGRESLQQTICIHNQPNSLPVLTFSDPQRFLWDNDYGHRVADKVLEYLFDIDKNLGTGRLWVP